ncbi:unnamed protein product [Prorocentrum cordatum]|uniref:Uncharacterized protein n=1 Tax=Prorocentrum cordatum TaxID=2364126 RepID=A0ABN9U0R2_9DINO|nr:unnamed protein product [Polarella glacialis]
MVSGSGFPGEVMREPWPGRILACMLLPPAPPPAAEAPAVAPAAPPQRMPDAPVPKRQRHGPAWRSDGLAPVLHDQQVREAAVEKWVVIVVAAGQHSRLGAHAVPAAQVRQAVSDILEVKQPTTMNKRAGAVGLYLTWARRSGCDPFPLAEQKVVDCLRETIQESPSRGTSFLEAVVFAGGMFGLAGADDALTRWTQGLAAKGLKRKNPKKQRAPFKAAHLSQAEGVVVLGYFVFATHVQGRCGNCARVSGEPVLDPPEGNRGFIEAAAGFGDHKTGHAARKAAELLPLVGLALGVSGKP